MTTTRLERLKQTKQPWNAFRPRLASVIMVAMVTLAAAICLAWFAGEGTIEALFQQLNQWQINPPMWLQVPMGATQYLLAPTVILLLIALVVMRVSPQPRTWSRPVVVGILLVLTLRYITWRSLSTLNLADPLNGVFSLLLFFLEMLVLGRSTLQLLLMLRVRDRRREADERAIAVINHTFVPTVDILIPTYNEPEFILRRTVIGCQAIAYPHKHVYLLDDTRRPEVRALAEELGCEYITRSDNHHAKAGNLNHALTRTHGELIVVFDADFIPTHNFLTRTVGFFQDPQVALVQTPQSYYNADPVARNLGLENVLTPEEEVFYRQIQPIRDAAGSVICSGTSFVVRRTALEAAGGFVTDSLSEDYFTGIRLAAQGYELVYLDEKLSAGLAADNMTDYATQRLRWARGTLQAFFIDANPLTIHGLKPWQRLAHFEGLLHWFTSISRVGFLLFPLLYSFMGVIPMRATPSELMYFFLPYYVVQFSVFAWLNYRSQSALFADIYALVLAFPLALTTTQAMFMPFSKGFKVTPKGTASDRYAFNWRLGLPLITLFALTAISLWRNLGMCVIKGGWVNAALDPLENLARADAIKGMGVGWIWSAYNLIMLSIVLLVLLDVPTRDHRAAWFNLRRIVKLHIPMPYMPRDQVATFWGSTTMMSDNGLEVALTQPGFPQVAAGEVIPVTVHICEEAMTLSGTAVQTGGTAEFPTVRIQFEALTVSQQRQLIELLFCRPGQWKRQNSPGEVRSLWLLGRTLFRPRILTDQTGTARAIAVTQG